MVELEEKPEGTLHSNFNFLANEMKTFSEIFVGLTFILCPCLFKNYVMFLE